MAWDTLTTREWANLIWFAGVLIWAMATAGEVRSAIRTLIATFLNWKILSIVAVAWIWLFSVVWCAAQVDLWTTDLLTDTAIAFVVLGVGLGFAAVETLVHPRSWWSDIRALFALSVALEYLLTLRTFNIWIELLLVPVVVCLLLTLSVAQREQGNEQAILVLNILLIAVAVASVAGTVWLYIGTGSRLDPAHEARTLALAFWLPVAMLPLVRALARVMRWENERIRRGIQSP